MKIDYALGNTALRWVKQPRRSSTTTTASIRPREVTRPIRSGAMPKSIASLPSNMHRRRRSLTAKTPTASLPRRGKAGARARARDQTATIHRLKVMRIPVLAAAARTPAAINKTTETGRRLVGAERVVAATREESPRQFVETHPRIASTKPSSTFERPSKATASPRNPNPICQPRARTGKNPRNGPSYSVLYQPEASARAQHPH